MSLCGCASTGSFIQSESNFHTIVKRVLQDSKLNFIMHFTWLHTRHTKKARDKVTQPTRYHEALTNQMQSQSLCSSSGGSPLCSGLHPAEPSAAVALSMTDVKRSMSGSLTGFCKNPFFSKEFNQSGPPLALLVINLGVVNLCWFQRNPVLATMTLAASIPA